MLEFRTLDTIPGPSLASRDVTVETEANLSAGLEFLFDTATADADPGVGDLRLNHLTPASVTQAFISETDRHGKDASGWLAYLDDNGETANRGRLRIVDRANEANWIEYKVTGTVTDGGAYRKVTLAFIAGVPSFASGAQLALIFSATGGAGGAPLDSPTFTGIPAGPTAAPDTSTTQLATTAYVQAELFDKADVDSPALTGVPTTPDVADLDDGDTIVNSRYVDTRPIVTYNGATAPILTAAGGTITGYSASIAEARVRWLNKNIIAFRMRLEITTVGTGGTGLARILLASLPQDFSAPGFSDQCLSCRLEVVTVTGSYGVVAVPVADEKWFTFFKLVSGGAAVALNWSDFANGCKVVISGVVSLVDP